MSLFISDGYTLDYTVKGRGPIPALKVKYRPAMPARVYEWRQKNAEAKTPAARLANDLQLLAEQLVSWDAGVPIDTEHLGRLWPQILTELHNVVTGYDFDEWAKAEGNSSPGGG